MRRIIVFDHLSADGYSATEDGKLDWVVPDEELTQSNLRNMAEADAILDGPRRLSLMESPRFPSGTVLLRYSAAS
jgi:hypothetical protein